MRLVRKEEGDVLVFILFLFITIIILESVSCMVEIQVIPKIDFKSLDLLLGLSSGEIAREVKFLFNL